MSYGFSWSSIDPNWKNWSTQQYQEALNHPIAQKGFDLDFNAMKWADVCVMVLPCGRSANTEAGWMKGCLLYTSEYLVKTYTNEGEIVLDNCIGSGTTAVACINTNRHFIGFENLGKHYYTACELSLIHI